MGADDGAFVQIGGDSKPLQQAASEAEKALANLSKAIRDLNKNADDSGKKLGGGGKDGLDKYKFSLDSMWESMLKSTGAFGGFMVALNSTIGVVTEIASVIGGAVEGFLQFAETIGGAVVDAVRLASDEISKLVEQIFELNRTTEQNTGSWRFIYGGAQNTQDLMGWTSKFSMSVPYTRQDLLGAITALGRAGLSKDQVEQYMSTVADMGALNPQRDLTGAAWSIQGAMHGYSRMLKYDYGISPDDLAKFGYSQDNPETTLMPALQAYLKGRGLTGSAKWASTNTFWGAWSSFEDRMQNIGLQLGGTQLNGQISQGSMFGTLKQDLTDISDWIDKHQSQISHLADLIGNVLGGAAHEATSAVKDLLAGLKDSGAYDWLLKQLSGFEPGPHGVNVSPNHDTLTRQNTSHRGGRITGEGGNTQGPGGASPQQQLSFWKELGALIGVAAKDAGIFGQNLVKGFANSGAVQSMAQGLANIVNWLSNPEHQKQIAALAQTIGNGLGQAINFAGRVANAFGQMWDNLTKNLDPEAWQAIKLVLLIIVGLLAASFIPLLVVVGVVAAVVVGVITLVVTIVWALIHAFEWLKNLDVGKLFSEIGKAIGSWADGLKTKFLTWGKDMMDNFIAGITSKISDLEKASQKAAGSIHKYLHFSKPDAGPLADIDKWMPDMTDLLVGGLEAGLPRIARASERAAATLRQVQAGAYGGGGGDGSSTSYATNTYGGATTVSNTFHGTSEVQMERVVERILGRRDLAENILSRRSGGYRPGLFGSIG